MPTTPHNRDFRRGRRLLEAICAEAASANETLDTMRTILDGRLSAALRLLEEGAAEYARAVLALQRVSRASDIKVARKASREFLASIGRNDGR